MKKDYFEFWGDKWYIENSWLNIKYVKEKAKCFFNNLFIEKLIFYLNRIVSRKYLCEIELIVLGEDHIYNKRDFKCYLPLFVEARSLRHAHNMVTTQLVSVHSDKNISLVSLQTHDVIDNSLIGNILTKSVNDMANYKKCEIAYRNLSIEREFESDFKIEDICIIRANDAIINNVINGNMMCLIHNFDSEEMSHYTAWKSEPDEQFKNYVRNFRNNERKLKYNNGE